MNCENIYYKNMIQKNINYKPYQLGFFKLNVDDFVSTINSMKERVNNFVELYWNQKDENIFFEINDINNLNNIYDLNFQNIDLFKILYHIDTKSLYVIINHFTIGGGDYLLLGSIMFNGKANSLFIYKNSILQQIKYFIYRNQFIFSVFKNLYYKYPRQRNNNEIIIYSQINKINKLYIIYKILTNIFYSISNTDKLVCLIPIGFENNIGNDIGVILFTFYKNTPYYIFKKNLYKLKNLAFGSKLLLCDNKINNFNILYDIETKFKKNIDVVITLGNIINNDIKLDIASSGMYYKMNYDFSYPYYIWGLSIDNKTHLTYSISDKLCDIDKLCNITNGSNITNKYIYKLNENFIKSNI